MARLVKVVLPVLIVLPLAVWALLSWCYAAREITRFYIDFPVWDYFIAFDHYAAYRTGHLGVLWEQHNEHRIVFPEILIGLDMLWCRGRIFLPTVSSFVFYAGIWAAMAWALWKDRAVSTVPRWASILLTAIVMTWHGSSAALATPFLVQWTMVQFAAILALVFLAKLSESRQPFWLWPICGCGVVCTFSSGDGLLMWLLLICFAAWLRISWRWIGVMAVAGALSIGVYFIGYEVRSKINWQAFLEQPAYVMQFMAVYVSMPFAIMRAEKDFPVRIGIVALSILAVLFFYAWRTRLLFTPTGIVLFGYAAFILCTGLMIAAGRMKPGDMNFEDAKAARYMTLPLTQWGVLAVALFWLLARVRFVGTTLATCVALGLSLYLFRLSQKPSLASYEGAISEGYANQQWAALAVESGLLDPAADLILHTDDNYDRRIITYARNQRLSLFSRPEAFWVGRDAKSIFPEATQPAAKGGIAAAQKLETAITIAGWSKRSSDLSHGLKLVLLDENNRIVGLGERLPAGLPARFNKLRIRKDEQWSGFVNLSYGSHKVSPYLVAEDQRSLIPLNSVLVLDAVK